jgi:hypothetical protein
MNSRTFNKLWDYLGESFHQHINDQDYKKVDVILNIKGKINELRINELNEENKNV